MLTSSLVLDDVLARVAQGIGEALGVWECDLYEYSPSDDKLIARAIWVVEPTPEDEEWVGTVVDLAGRPSYREVLQKGRLTEDRLDGDDLDPADRQLMEQWGELSTLSVPLRFQDETIGCLVLIEKRSFRRFSDDEKELLRELAVPAAIAIHNARLFLRQEEQARHLASLLDSGRAVASTVVLEDVLQVVARKMAEALGVQEASIYEYDEDRRAIVRVGAFVALQSDEESRSHLGRECAIDEWPTNRRVMETGEPVQEAVGATATDPAARALMLEFGQKSTLTVPAFIDDRPIGMIELVETDYERQFTLSDIQLAQSFGEQAAVAIANAKLFQREERLNRRLVSLLDASRSIAASLRPESIIERVCAEVADLLGGDGVRMRACLRTDAGDCRPFDAPPEHQGGEAGEGEVPPPDAAVERALATLAPVQAALDGGTRLVVPLVLRGTAEGYIEAVTPTRRQHDQDELELVQIVANQAAVALENARLYDRIEREAVTDGLTGLYNHRYFYKRLQEEVATSQRYGAPLSLLMLDLDDFKDFNDTYGHPAGDQVLREVADILRKQLRALVDIPARYGGEEFAVILPNTPLSGAEAAAKRLWHYLDDVCDGAAPAGEPRDGGGGDGVVPATAAAPIATAGVIAPPAEEAADAVGERIRRNIAAAHFEGRAGKRYAHMTASIGIAGFPEHARGAQELVNCADKALYLAKRLGKNRVETYS